MDKSFSLSDLTSFDKLIAPKVLRIVYWIGLAGIALAFLGAIYNALSMMSYSFVGALIALVTAVLVCAFAVLFWRIIIEIYTVFFGIYDRLGEIKTSLDSKP